MLRRPGPRMAIGALLLGAAGLLVVTGAADGGKKSNPAATRCLFPGCLASGNRAPARGYEGAYVVADPRAPDHVVVVDDDLLAARCGWHTTFDRGKDWIDGAFALPAGFTGCRIDGPSGGHVPSGSVVMGSTGRVYAVFGAAASTDAGHDSVLVATSVDGGRTFLPARVAVAPAPGVGLARPLMTVTRGAAGQDSLLVSMWSCHPASPRGTSCDGALFARSDDAGVTFSAPVVINDPPGGQNPSQPAVGTHGTVYETFQRRFADGHVDLFLARSGDGGATFTRSPIDTEKGIGVAYDPAKLVVDPRSDALYTVWSDARTGSQQVIFRKSTDKGATWTQALLLAPDPGRTGSSRSPSISVAPDGRIDIVYYHTDPSRPASDDVYLDYSTDGGATFVVRQVNDKPIDRNLGFSGPAGSLGEVGNHYPPTVSSLDNAAYVAYSDTADSTRATQVQDVVMREMVIAGSPA